LAEKLAAAQQAEASKQAKKTLSEAFSLTDIKFKTGSALLTSASKSRLDKAVSTMKKYEGYSYKIQGHTDSLGNESTNITLSTKRARAVKRYLVSQGIDDSILEAEGFGSALPIADNGTRAGREKNRRVVFEIIK
jgi:outer membrane protein OmpA-like peptidoglycan-associated protein